MTTATARKIFADLNNDQYTTEEKIEAIVEVTQMPNHKSVKKEDMLNAILVLLGTIKGMLDDTLPEEPEKESTDEE